ncbi:amino acid ABC transporter substrate-binding protein [Levilactobacillus bambusae]|uniref:Amino acid ABC transporter substrate-binding protein n=1 Tax=Levilactobacillus bambusae TaxID=2024736 RepID=A0A2V1MX93_9LACO|nr:amino acid ABC transporter substrate-binding protein [Levilactobacillus bambusae]PWF99636.1 amino acid ABC transporter substrate-binding protein [Levilactobacillus bambusae]
MILLLVSLSTVLAGCQSAAKRADHTDSWSQIEKKKTVVVGLDDSFVPMGFREKNGRLVGYDVDLARAVFKLYGIHVDFQTIDWSMNVTELNNGTIDLIWNGYSVTPERKEKVAFSQPYLENDQVLVALKKNRINVISDMKGKSLGVQSGSSALFDLDDQPQLLKNQIKNQTPVQYDTFTNAFIDLNSGRIQGLLLDSTYAQYYIHHEADPKAYSVIAGPFPKEQFAVGMRKSDQTMRRKINAGLDELAKNGTLAKINHKWFGQTANSPLLAKP